MNFNKIIIKLIYMNSHNSLNIKNSQTKETKPVQTHFKIKKPIKNILKSYFS